MRIIRMRLRLFRIEAKSLELTAPFRRQIAEAFDADATGEATFYGGFDEIGCQEGERDHQIDLPDAALFACSKLGDVGHSTRDNVIQEAATSGDGANQARTAFEILRSNVGSRPCI